MATLYELSDQYERLLELAEDPDTDPGVIYDTMEALGGELEAKADNYAIVIAELNGRADILEKEIFRLEARKKACLDNVKRMKASLQMAMDRIGLRKIKTDRFSFNIQANTPLVVLDVDSWQDIPEDYLRYRDPEVDKVKLRKAIQDGVDLSGVAHLAQQESLRIR